jgi:uncharacterized protein YjeT (DUF2065 family)
VGKSARSRAYLFERKPAGLLLPDLAFGARYAPRPRAAPRNTTVLSTMADATFARGVMAAALRHAVAIDLLNEALKETCPDCVGIDRKLELMENGMDSGDALKWHACASTLFEEHALEAPFFLHLQTLGEVEEFVKDKVFEASGLSETNKTTFVAGCSYLEMLPVPQAWMRESAKLGRPSRELLIVFGVMLVAAILVVLWFFGFLSGGGAPADSDGEPAAAPAAAEGGAPTPQGGHHHHHHKKGAHGKSV